MRLRLRVRHLILGVGATAMVFGALFATYSDWTWALFAVYPLLILTKRGRPMARWFPAVLALLVASLSAGGVRDFGVVFVAGFAFLLTFCTFPLVLRHWDGRLHRPGLIVLVTSLIAIVSVVLTAWPVRLAFFASRREFDDLAGRLEAGYRMTKPERVGRFLILKAEMRDGRPCLWIDTDPAGYDGFVRNPRRGPDGKLLGPSNRSFNLWSAVSLDDDWAFISED